MDDLDKQLAELQLLNNADLLSNSSMSNHGTLGKKIGPAVPPKPKKQQPQVPQSYQVKQQCEPSYSTRLQTNATAAPQAAVYSNIPPPTSSMVPQLHSMINSAPEKFAQVQSAKPYVKNNYQDPNLMYSNLQVNAGPPRGVIKNSDGLIYSNIIHPPPTERNDRHNLYSNLNIVQQVPQGNVYANGGEEFPLPPPPLDLTAPAMFGTGDYVQCNVNTSFPPPPEDLPPPPSPVSSSYSELRRATDTGYPIGQDYQPYTMGSQTSSTYESIYEPINPRPPSQMSSRSNYSLYAPYVSGSQSGTLTRRENTSAKEVEVDHLTDLLVQGMGSGDDADVYGICVKCGQKVIGENSGCTAMEQVYHISCFTCHQCAINLQGKPFYCLDGKPFCEEDYLNTLEKCSVCLKPILDRILRATGKPYHPKCFCCVVCGKSLDGIPFTVDATNQIHCIEDFHKKFAPRCCVCKMPIMPEPGQEETVRVVALDRSFHINCYKCEDCGLVLSSEAEGRGCYPLDDHVLCKGCNANRVQSLTNLMTTEL